jgi:molybdopterin synthase sulfur carrier subunit
VPTAPAPDRPPTSTAPPPGPPTGPAASATNHLTVRYFAGARAAANGVSTEPVTADTIDNLVRVLTDRHGERLGVVLKAASFLVDGLACHDRQAPLPVGATVDVLPPFAGG